MLELLSPKKIENSPHRQKLKEAGIDGGWNYYLDHAWLYEKIDAYKKETGNHNLIILDVGCGNSMLHTFLEEELKVGIIGIDRVDGQCPYPNRDRRMDLCIDFAKENQFFKNTADVVYWCSAIEHNTLEGMTQCMEVSLDALKPGGLFLATFAVAKQTHYYEPSEQYNLSIEDAMKVFSDKWEGSVDIETITNEFKDNFMQLNDRHKKRYGTDEYDFIVGAIAKRKE